MELHLTNFSEDFMRYRGCLCPTAKLHLGRTMQLWMQLEFTVTFICVCTLHYPVRPVSWKQKFLKHHTERAKLC